MRSCINLVQIDRAVKHCWAENPGEQSTMARWDTALFQLAEEPAAYRMNLPDLKLDVVAESAIRR